MKKAAMERYAMKRMRRKFKALQKVPLQLRPGMSQLNPNLYPGMSQLNPNLYPGMSQLNRNLYPGMSQLNPNLYPGMSQLNPNLYPGMSQQNIDGSEIDWRTLYNETKAKDGKKKGILQTKFVFFF